MLITVFLNTMENQGLSREVTTTKLAKQFASEFGWQRIHRIVVTDLRPLPYTDGDGKPAVIEPDI